MKDIRIAAVTAGMALASIDWDNHMAPFLQLAPAVGEHSPAHHVFGSAQTAGAHARGIPLDVIETKEAFDIKADIPGVDRQAIKLCVDGDTLSLSVHKSTENGVTKEADGVKYHRMERATTWARRSLRLPAHAELDKISAKYADGVLHVQVPKTDAKERTRTVQIN